MDERLRQLADEGDLDALMAMLRQAKRQNRALETNASWDREPQGFCPDTSPGTAP